MHLTQRRGKCSELNHRDKAAENKEIADTTKAAETGEKRKKGRRSFPSWRLRPLLASPFSAWTGSRSNPVTGLLKLVTPPSLEYLSQAFISRRMERGL